MAAQFNDGGLRFQYPENWRLEREDNDTGWTVTVQSPGTAFVMISLREDLPTPEELSDTVLEALRVEYPDLEAEERVDSLAGQMAVGHNIQFFSLDLTNTCWTRSIHSPQGTVLVLWQTSDLDLETTEPVLRAICASMEVDEE